MGKDLNTTIAGAIGFLVLIANWVFGLVGITFTIPPEIQAAIVGLCVLVIGWYIGKPNEQTPEKLP